MNESSSDAFAVVHVAETIRGGIATYLREILALQVRRYGRNRVAVIAPRDQIPDLGEQAGVRVIPVEKANSRLVTARRARAQLRALLADHAVEILHLHSAFAGMVCRAPVLRPLGVRRIVYCPHGWAFKRQGRSVAIARFVERALSRRCHAIVCVSQAEKESALKAGLPSAKLALIRNGLPDNRPVADKTHGLWQPGVLRLVFVGRFDRQKGFDVLLDALKRIDRPVEVHVFGDSVLAEYAVRDTGASIRLHGWQSFDAIEPFLTTCDAMVMPSRWEGLSISALEAMRAAKPLIASRVGGLSELVEDGVSGILTAAGDSAALAAILDSVDATALGAMGAHARQRFLDTFLIDRCEEKLAIVYGPMTR